MLPILREGSVFLFRAVHSKISANVSRRQVASPPPQAPPVKFYPPLLQFFSRERKTFFRVRFLSVKGFDSDPERCALPPSLKLQRSVIR